MANGRFIYQSAGNHVPANESLQAPEKENKDKFFNQGFIELFLQEEIEERNKKYYPYHPANKPVYEFPPEYGFELLNIHIKIHFLELRGELVLLKGYLPVVCIQRRNTSHDDVPFGYGKP